MCCMSFKSRKGSKVVKTSVSLHEDEWEAIDKVGANIGAEDRSGTIRGLIRIAKALPPSTQKRAALEGVVGLRAGTVQDLVGLIELHLLDGKIARAWRAKAWIEAPFVGILSDSINFSKSSMAAMRERVKSRKTTLMIVRHPLDSGEDYLARHSSKIREVLDGLWHLVTPESFSIMGYRHGGTPVAGFLTDKHAAVSHTALPQGFFGNLAFVYEKRNHVGCGYTNLKLTMEDMANRALKYPDWDLVALAKPPALN